MRNVLIAVAIVGILSIQSARADIIFEVSMRNPGPIKLGDIAIFDISLRTSPNDISNLGGVTFFLGANDPNADGGITAGGIFGLGTNDPSSQLADGRTYLFNPTEGGFFNVGESFVVFSAAGANRNLSTTGGLLGSVELNTMGAVAGTHEMSFSSLDAVDALANPLTGPFSGAVLQYTIVPEPSSFLAFASLAFCVSAVRCRRGLPV